MRIELNRRIKYAGDVHIALMKLGWAPELAATFLNNIPDAKIADPVRHGRWVGRRLGSTDVICSKCSTLETNRDSNYKSRFCPGCGAIMDGDSNGPIKRK